MSVIEDIKQKIDIVELVSAYVTLHKAGHNFKALCPFHAEKTPSFFVFPDRQTWHCFGGCATGGDIFAFVMKKENVEFGEALRRLAERAGIQLVPSQRDETEKEEVVRLRQINLSAAQFFHNFLLNLDEARSVRQYLEKRGVSPASIEAFQLGYAPKGWDRLLNYLKERGYSEKEITAAGLAIEKETGGCYDRFRYRLVFPIRDQRGNTVGFGGRALDDSMPKYLNSSQSVIFDKSGLLYGLDHASSAIRKADLAVIVEGYMDVIICHQYGFGNVVASMGTALTEKHIFSLKKLTKNLVLALDPDTAGEAATLRGLEVAAEAFDQKTVPIPNWQASVSYENVLDAEIRVAVLPEGKDPDELILQNREAWASLVKGARPLLDYVISLAGSRYDLASADGKSKAVEYLSPIITRIKDPIRKIHYLQKLAHLVNIEERTLAKLVDTGSNTTTGKGRYRTREIGLEPSVKLPRSTISNPLEEYCLSMLLQWPELKGLAEGLTAKYFENTENRVVFENWLLEADIDRLRESIPASLGDHFSLLLNRAFPPTDPLEKKKALKDCILRLRENYLKNLKIKEAFILAEPGDADTSRILTDGLELNVKLKDVFKQRGSASKSQEESE